MSSRTEQPDVIIPVEHGEPCFAGVGQKKPGKIWNIYFLVDGGKTKQWTNLEFKKAGDAIKYSMNLNLANGLRSS